MKTETEGTTSLHTIYHKLHTGKRLKGGKAVTTFQHVTKISCALSCSRDESCNSFTLCDQRVCYLNSDNVPNEMTLVDADKSCRLYFNIKAAQGISKLNQALETTSAPITEHQDTFCFPSSKGNGVKCIEINDFGQWYTFVDEPMSWESAKHFCEYVNGVLLFSKTWSSHGSIDASMILFHELGFEFIWVGIRVFDGELVDVTGGIQSNIIVGGGAELGPCLVLIDYFRLEQRDCATDLPFICELNSPVE